MKDKLLYEYKGPVYYFNRLIAENWQDETFAVSFEQALNNLTFKAKNYFNYKANSAITLDSSKLYVSENQPESEESNKEIKCDICGRTLNDGGTCPVCDDAVEDYFESLHKITIKEALKREESDFIDNFVDIYIDYISLDNSDKLIENFNNTKELSEKIEKHDTLNPKLWNEDKTLKDEVREKILEIVKEFTNNLEENEIKFKIKDIKIVGSNCSYNYTKDSDLDIHIVMDTKNLECPANLYPLLYSAYRSIFNSKFDIDFYGIPVELYIETDDTEDLNKVEESLSEDYPMPKKLYSINDKKATWDNDAQDYIWWDSESKYNDKYATCYKVKMSPKEFLDLTTSKGADSIKLGDDFRKLDVDEFNKEIRQPIFLIIEFNKNSSSKAKVVGHEGRHRMFALMKEGIEEVDVQIKVCSSNFDKYNPYELATLELESQFSNRKITVNNPIIMSYAKHKELNPNLTLQIKK
jgi:predicted nucleotidyltransferase